MIAIVNSSPLIYLGKLGLLHILDAFFDKVITVQSVKKEVLDKAAPEYSVLANAFSTWIVVYDHVKTTISKKLNEMGLHQGEIGVLDLAYHLKNEQEESVVIIDDLAVRDVARALGLRLTGTLGIVLRAAKRGIISKKESLNKINFLVTSTSFRMSTGLYSRIIAELDG